MKRITIISVFLLMSFSLLKGKTNLDSLYGVWENSNLPDTTRIDALGKLLWKGVLWSNPDSAFALSRRGFQFASIDENKKGMTSMMNIQGIYYSNKGNFSQALNSFASCLQIHQKSNNLSGIASSYNNIGLMFQKSSEMEKATEYFMKSYDIHEGLGNESGMASSYNNVGLCYFANKQMKTALGHFKISLEIANRLGELDSKSDYTRNIGYVYLDMKKYEIALEYFNQSLEIDLEFDNKANIATSYRNIGKIHLQVGNLLLSEEFEFKAISLANEIGFIRVVNDATKDLYHLYKKKGDYSKSLQMLKEWKTYTDSINKQINARSTIEQQFEFEYKMKETLEKATHDEKLKLSVEKEKRQEIVSIVVVFGFFLMLAFSYLIYKRLRLTSLQKEIIEEQKKDITDSINYAKRIQDSMLPSNELIDKVLPDSFVLFQPKDIVSGDFYWVGEKDEYTFFAACDCTGHGIPGAFMSMIGNVLLNEIILLDGETSTKKILDRMRLQIIHSLNQKGVSGESRDGMDMVLCRYDKKKQEILYTGAYNSLVHISNNQLVTLKGDRRPVGYFKGMNIPFTETLLTVERGDCLYLFSDGYQDQFGGENNKKFKISRLKSIFEEINEKPMSDQKQILESTMAEWKGDAEQIDDILVMGMRF